MGLPPIGPRKGRDNVSKFRRPKRAQERPKRAQEGPKQEAPIGPQEAPKRSKRGPKRAPQRPPNCLGQAPERHPMRTRQACKTPLLDDPRTARWFQSLRQRKTRNARGSPCAACCCTPPIRGIDRGSLLDGSTTRCSDPYQFSALAALRVAACLRGAFC